MIEKIHKKLNDVYNLSEKEMVFARTVKLSEEVWELCNEVLASYGIQRKEKLKTYKKNNIKNEIIDVITTALLIARCYNYSVSDILSEIIETRRDYQLIDNHCISENDDVLLNG